MSTVLPSRAFLPSKSAVALGSRFAVNASSLSLLFGTVIALGSPLAANATVSEALNWARVSGCSAAAPRGVPRAPLRESSTLRQVAARLAAGDSLHAALARASYSADNSSAVHLRGA